MTLQREAPAVVAGGSPSAARGDLPAGAATSPAAADPPAAPAEQACADLAGAGSSSGDLGWALATVLRAHLRAAEQVLSDLPGGARAHRLLAAVAQQPQPSQLALAEAAGLDRTVVTYLLDKLVAAGLVERQADPCDRRARRIVLTPSGTSRLAGFRGRLLEVDQQVFTALDAGEAAQLRLLLDRSARGLRDADPTCRQVAELAGVDPQGPAGGC